MQISPYGKRRDLEKVAEATRCPRCKSKDGFADGRCLNCQGSAPSGRRTPKMESPEQMETLEMEGDRKGSVVKVAGFKGAMQSEFEMMQDPTRQRGRPAAPKGPRCEFCHKSEGMAGGKCKACGKGKGSGGQETEYDVMMAGSPYARSSSNSEVKVAAGLWGTRPEGRPAADETMVPGVTYDPQESACPMCAQEGGGKVDPGPKARLCRKHKEELDRQFKGQGPKETVRDDPRAFGGVVGVGKVAGWADALVKAAGFGDYVPNEEDKESIRAHWADEAAKLGEDEPQREIPQSNDPLGPNSVSFGWNLNFADEDEADVTVTAELEPHVPQTFDSPAEGGGVYIEKIVRDSTGEEVDLESVSDETLRELEERAGEASGERDEGLRGAAEEARFQEHRDEPRGERELGTY